MSSCVDRRELSMPSWMIQVVVLASVHQSQKRIQIASLTLPNMQNIRYRGTRWTSIIILKIKIWMHFYATLYIRLLQLQWEFHMCDGETCLFLHAVSIVLAGLSNEYPAACFQCLCVFGIKCAFVIRYLVQCGCCCLIKHWVRDEMENISQTAFSNVLFFNENDGISIKISRMGSINNIPWVQTLAWCRPVDKTLSEPMMVKLPTHICITRPQWVKLAFLGNKM